MQSILVIALSARAYAEAAHEAGFQVSVIDAFADSQTVAIAQHIRTVAYDTNGFAPQAMLRVLQSLPLKDFLGVIYGSGLDAQPDLLAEIATLLPLIGNAPGVVRNIKQPQHFFGLLAAQGVLFPAVKGITLHTNLSAQHCISQKEAAALLQAPATQWLKKQVGGAGGAHVQFKQQASAGQGDSAPAYYEQAYVAGRPYSLLFLADGQAVTNVSFNAQLLASTKESPFRYGGAVSHVRLPENVKAYMTNAARLMTLQYGLVGLNSLDVVVRDATVNNGKLVNTRNKNALVKSPAITQAEVFVLEINPRLSASFDVQANRAALMLSHIKACGFAVHACQTHVNQTTALTSMKEQTVQLQDAMKPLKTKPRAARVLYAKRKLTIAQPFVWPAWAHDTPSVMKLNEDEHHINVALMIEKNAPICTVYAEADSATAAKKLVNQRVRGLSLQLYSMQSERSSYYSSSCLNLKDANKPKIKVRKL